MVGHYPDYNVMNLADEWDSHTKEIVKRRLGPFPGKQYLNEHEARTIWIIATHLAYDNREDILDYVVHHIDSELASEVGESQRKAGIPKGQDLIRSGLRALDNLSLKVYQKDFADAETGRQFSMLESLQKGEVMDMPGWPKPLQKELFKKVLNTIVRAYYSHPQVWSEIGYGGPAYPRGYIRVELGLTEPWEAKRNGK